MADKDNPTAVGQEQAEDLELIKRRLDMLDHRLDNIDSVVSVVAERVMKQPITFGITCPHCGKNIEVAVLGIEKPTK